MTKMDELLDQAKEHLDKGEDALAANKGTDRTKKMGKDSVREHLEVVVANFEVRLRRTDKESDGPAFLAQVRGEMTRSHATPSAPPAGVEPAAADQIRKLAQLRDEGLITDDEFKSKRTELLARL